MKSMEACRKAYHRLLTSPKPPVRVSDTFVSLTVPLAEIVELCGDARCLLPVPLDHIEMCEDVQADLDKELEAEQGEDGQIDVGVPRAEWPLLQKVSHCC